MHPFILIVLCAVSYLLIYFLINPLIYKERINSKFSVYSILIALSQAISLICWIVIITYSILFILIFFANLSFSGQYAQLLCNFLTKTVNWMEFLIKIEFFCWLTGAFVSLFVLSYLIYYRLRSKNR